MCHQFDGAHTWNNCTDDILAQRVGDTAFEPGSGSTIMGYPGSCLSNDIASKNDAYFHTASIDQVRIYTTLGPGNNCGTETILTNNLPTVVIDQPDGISIPKSTPFILSAKATDPDSNEGLTYCWEQFDLGDTIDLGKQKTGNQPLFRSFEPSPTGSRFFPRITTVMTIASNISKTELLPDRTRNLSFRCTVRDNAAGGGGVSADIVHFKVSGDAGPFTVDAPATSAIWQVGSYQDVTWKVNNTDKAPVNCKTVNIWLSTTGSNGFNIKLASNVPNSGKACVLVPNNVSTIARVLVEAADNIFYDINPGNFRIQQPAQPGFDICIALAADLACLPRKYEVAVASGSLLGFTSPVTMSVTGLPAGASAFFSKNPIAPGETAQMTIDFPAGTPEGTYNIKVAGTSGTATAETTTQLTVVANDYTGLTLTAPLNGITDGSVTALKWNTVPDAISYEVAIAENPAFDPPLASASNLTTGTWTLPVSLSSSKIYFWRVRGFNECGASDWTEPYFFATPIQICTTLVSTDVPKNISANSLNTVESKIDFGQNGVLTDVNVVTVKGNHAFFKDLDTRLVAPGGQQTILFSSKCGSYNGTFNFGFDGASVTEMPCPPSQPGIYKPSGNLGLLNGTDAKGSWILRVRDNVVGSGGQLAEFALQLCFGKEIQSPTLVNNNILTLPGTSSAVIGSNLLKVEDPNNSASQLLYTLITVPARGVLRLNNAVLPVGSNFTQADIDSGILRYEHTSTSAGSDRFRFLITDGEGGFYSDTFRISPVVGAFEAPENTLNFEISPNPATEQLNVQFGTPLSAVTNLSLFDVTGRLVRRWQADISHYQTQVSLSGIPSGIYVLQVENETGRGVKKVQKR
jgi:subtilisin-like proprotein convertase family protein